jgi:large subunit ribosomal protein L19
MMNKINYIESSQFKKDIPELEVGDTVRVYAKIQEEGKGRIQAFEGIVIGIKSEGLRRTITVRKISYGEGVEKTFPVHSPSIDRISIVKKGKVRRAKLYYLRKKIGKKTKIKGKEIPDTTPDTPLREEGTQERP